MRKRTDLPAARFRIPLAMVLVPAAVAICLLLATAAGWSALATAVALLAVGFAIRALVRR